MSRDMRQEYYGGIYHVIARGNNKEYIFRQEQDKGYFIKILREAMGVVPRGWQCQGDGVIDTLCFLDYSSANSS